MKTHLRDNPQSTNVACAGRALSTTVIPSEVTCVRCRESMRFALAAGLVRPSIHLWRKPISDSVRTERRERVIA